MNENAVDQLFEAFQDRDSDTIQELAKSTHIDARDPDGLTVLMRTAAVGDADGVGWILDAGADPNALSLTSATWHDDELEYGETVPSGVLQMTAVLREWPGEAPPESEGALHQTALMFAAENGHVEALKRLLKAGADPNLLDHDGGTALMAAAAQGEAAAVHQLLSGQPRLVGPQKINALKMAAAAGEEATVQTLVRSGVDPSSSEGLGTGLAPLDYAAMEGHAHIVELLFNSGVRFRSRGSSLMMEAITRGHTEVVRLLLAHQNTDNQMAPRNLLLLAVASGQAGIVDLLAQAGVDLDTPDLDQRTPLRVAIEGGHAGAARALLDAGAAVDLVPEAPPNAKRRGDGRTPLMAAAARGDAEIVRALIEHGAEVDRALPAPPDDKDDPEGLLTALMFAAREGHADATRALIEGGADIRRRNADDEPVLGVAVRAGQRETANLIRMQGASPAEIMEARVIGALKLEDAVTLSSVLAAGADPDAMDRLPEGGWAPALTLAARRGDAQSVFVLLGAEADPNAVVEGGPAPWERTPLMFAAAAGHADVVLALMQGGADPELTDHRPDGSDRTAFMSAAAEGRVEVLKVFKRTYDKIDYRSPDGWTALTCAAAAGEVETVRLLLSWGAEIADERQSALVEAVLARRWEVMEQLLSVGADVDAPRGDRMTPLMAAAVNGEAEAVQRLLAAGADAALTDAAGQNARAYAAAGGHASVLALLGG